MTRRIGRLIQIVLLFVAAVAFAHEGHTHKIMGTVTAVDNEQVTVRATDGKAVSIRLDADTKYRKGDEPGAAADLKVGSRVVVEAAGKDQLAKTIYLASDSGKPPHAH